MFGSKDDEDSTRPGLRVSSRGERFWRAGIQFTREPQDLPLNDLNEEQIDAIQGESMLVVEEVDIDIEVAADETEQESHGGPDA